MVERYLRDSLAVDKPGAGELAANSDAGALLRWALVVADQAEPQHVYRHKEGRKTLRFRYQGGAYFLKLHRGVGWAEIAKNLLQFRLPVLAATNEYRAVTALQRIGVDTLTVAAYARRGLNPATTQSMIVTDDLTGTVSLEDYCANWASEPPAPATRMRLIRKLADSARRMHGAGINHRDFYICHFHLDPGSISQPSPRCYLIDLHRAQLRNNIPRRWRIKDLAGLYFSAMDCGLTRRDLLRFMHHYSTGGLGGALGDNASLWRAVERRAARLYQKAHGCEPPAVVTGGSHHGC